MDAIVLAGGYATRLWPITRHRPKMFLPVGDTTVIDRILRGLEADDRIEQVFVSTNQRFADRFETYLAESSFNNPQVSIEGTTAEAEKLGVVGALAELVKREGLSRDTIVVAGDNLLSFSLSAFIDHFQAHDGPTLAAYDVGTMEKARQYGVVGVSDGVVQSFIEKPDEPPSTLASIACYGFPATVLPLLEEYLAGDNNPDEPGWFLQWLVDRESVGVFEFDGAWFDIGTPASYLDAVAWHLDGDARVAESATVTDTTLGDDVHVMAGAEVSDSHLERTIVFPEATVNACEIRDSIIDECAALEGIDLAGAQIAAHTTLASDPPE